MSTWSRTIRALVLATAGDLGANGIMAIGALISTTLAALGVWQWAQAYGPHIVVGMALVNIVVVWMVSRRSRHAIRIVESCGFTRFWPARARAWQACVQAISNHDEVLIADATGAEIHEGSALGKALLAHAGNIKVIWLRPESLAFARRVSDVAGCDDHSAMLLANQYRSERERALRFLTKLCDSTKNKRRSIEIRECEYGAIWKTFISGEKLWLQLEDAGTDGDPALYMLTRDKGTFAPGFEKMFFERWESGRMLLRQDENSRTEPNS